MVAKMLKAIHAQESKKASREKTKAVVAELRAMKLKGDADLLRLPQRTLDAHPHKKDGRQGVFPCGVRLNFVM